MLSVVVSRATRSSGLFDLTIGCARGPSPPIPGTQNTRSSRATVTGCSGRLRQNSRIKIKNSFRGTFWYQTLPLNPPPLPLRSLPSKPRHSFPVLHSPGGGGGEGGRNNTMTTSCHTESNSSSSPLPSLPYVKLRPGLSPPSILSVEPCDIPIQFIGIPSATSCKTQHSCQWVRATPARSSRLALWVSEAF